MRAARPFAALVVIGVTGCVDPPVPADFSAVTGKDDSVLIFAANPPIAVLAMVCSSHRPARLMMNWRMPSPDYLNDSDRVDSLLLVTESQNVNNWWEIKLPRMTISKGPAYETLVGNPLPDTTLGELIDLAPATHLSFHATDRRTSLIVTWPESEALAKATAACHGIAGGSE